MQTSLISSLKQSVGDLMQEACNTSFKGIKKEPPESGPERGI